MASDPTLPVDPNETTPPWQRPTQPPPTEAPAEPIPDEQKDE